MCIQNHLVLFSIIVTITLMNGKDTVKKKAYALKMRFSVQDVGCLSLSEQNRKTL